MLSVWKGEDTIEHTNVSVIYSRFNEVVEHLCNISIHMIVLLNILNLPMYS